MIRFMWDILFRWSLVVSVSVSRLVYSRELFIRWIRLLRFTTTSTTILRFDETKTRTKLTCDGHEQSGDICNPTVFARLHLNRQSSRPVNLFRKIGLCTLHIARDNKWWWCVVVTNGRKSTSQWINNINCGVPALGPIWWGRNHSQLN